jgi:TIR domain
MAVLLLNGCTTIDDVKTHGLTPWLEVQDMAPGSDWNQEIDKALRAAQTVVVVLTPGAVISPQVTSEWNYAVDQGTDVISLLALDCEIPRLLRIYNWIDFRTDYASALTGLVQNFRVKRANAEAAPSATDPVRIFISHKHHADDERLLKELTDYARGAVEAAGGEFWGDQELKASGAFQISGQLSSSSP